MSLIVLRGRIRRWRCHALSVVLIVVLAGAIAVHHAVPSLGETHHASGVAAIAELCLGVLMVIGVGAVAAPALHRIERWRPSRGAASAAERSPARRLEVRARAGPAGLVLLCVSRR